MKKAIKNKFLINLVSFLSSTTISFSQAAYIPPVVGSSGYNYISASSTMLPDLGYNFVPKNIDDNSLYTWWSPLREDNSTCWIKINFGKERLINKIQIHGGAHFPDYKLGNLYVDGMHFVEYESTLIRVLRHPEAVKVEYQRDIIYNILICSCICYVFMNMTSTIYFT